MRPMAPDDPFDELVAGLGGFYRTWFACLGIELGLFARIREAGAAGIAPDDLARAAGVDLAMLRGWAWGAGAHGLVDDDGTRLRLDGDLARVLLDPDRPEYLGGQVVHAATASLDYAALAEVMRTGRPVRERPDRYRVAIERLTAQDVAVFFAEALPELPNLVASLGPGSRVVDLHCGGGRWLIAMARRFPGVRLTGIEFEADSVARARASIAEAGLTDRIAIELGEPAALDRPATYDLAYFQYALHQLPDPAGALAAAWAAVRPGGWLCVLDWYLPADPDEMRSRQGELIAGVQLDELFMGTRLVTRGEALGWFAAARLPAPLLVDLPSGATLIAAERGR